MKNPLYFTHHVTESIEINCERRPYYKNLTAGKSERAFQLLITLEYLMIPSARFYDWRAHYYQKNGIPLLRDELVSMNRTPEFDATLRIVPETKSPAIPWRKYQRDLKAAIGTGDSKIVLACTSKIIDEMSHFPHFYPMTRHIVESIHRFAWFYPGRERAAREKNLKDPKKLVFGIMNYHLLGFWYFILIDRASIPVHREGIPMLSSELPDLLADLTPV